MGRLFTRVNTFSLLNMKTIKDKVARFVPTLVLVILSAAVFLSVFKGGKGRTSKVRSYSVMGGILLEVKLYGTDADLEAAFDAVYRQVELVDKACDIYKPDSELSRLNQTAYKKPFICSDLLWDLLMESKRYYEVSEGSFDISATPLMKLWGFYRRRKALPSPAEVAEAKKYVGLDKVVFDMERRSVRFTVPGMRLDLGGIAKGFAVDLAAKAAKKHNVTVGIINLSGNAYCFQEAFPGKDKYVIGVRNPLHKNMICGTVSILNKSVATSGDYERYVIINGKHYAHIMDPRTGDPVEDMLSATVITPSATAADALSTTIFINGAKFAEKFHEKHPDTSFLIIRKNKQGKPEMIKIGDIWGGCSLITPSSK